MTSGLSHLKGQWSWLHYPTDTEQKKHPQDIGDVKTTANTEKH